MLYLAIRDHLSNKLLTAAFSKARIDGCENEMAVDDARFDRPVYTHHAMCSSSSRDSYQKMVFLPRALIFRKGEKSLGAI